MDYSDPTTFAVIAACLGAIIGSFLNVVILRLPPRLEWFWQAQAREVLEAGSDGGIEAPEAPPGIVWESSFCPSCDAAIKPWDNIPLLGFALLRGRCRSCKTSISWQYPFVELLTAIAFLCCVLAFGVTAQAGLAMLFSALLIAGAGIDTRTQLLPDVLTLPLLWLGLLISTQSVFASPVDAIVGAAVGYLSLWSVFWLFKLLTGKEGMGYGDFKLLAALGAWLGWQGLLGVILVSSVVGVIVGGTLMAATKRGRDVPMPFGPFLAAAGWIMLLFGERLAQWLPLLRPA